MSSSFDLLPLLFVFFAFIQNGHLKNGVFVGSAGMPLLHFPVLFIVFFEQWPKRCCLNSRSFNFYDNAGVDDIIKYLVRRSARKRLPV